MNEVRRNSSRYLVLKSKEPISIYAIFLGIAVWACERKVQVLLLSFDLLVQKNEASEWHLALGFHRLWVI